MESICMKFSDLKEETVIGYIEEDCDEVNIMIVLSVEEHFFNEYPVEVKPSYVPGYKMQFLTTNGIVTMHFAKTSRMNCESSLYTWWLV